MITRRGLLEAAGGVLAFGGRRLDGPRARRRVNKQRSPLAFALAAGGNAGGSRSRRSARQKAADQTDLPAAQLRVATRLFDAGTPIDPADAKTIGDYLKENYWE